MTWRSGRSKIRLARDGARFFLIILKIATFFSPFRVFFPLSLLSFLLGTGYYAYTYFTERRFTNWRMGRVDLDRINAGMVLKYSEKPRLDPFQVSGRVAIALLQDVMEAALIVG